MGINVAITGLHATDNPAPGIGVIRSLQHPNGWDGKIIGLAYDAMDTGVYDDGLLDHTYMISYPNQNTKAILDRLLYIHEQQRIDVIIPTLDSELPLYQRLEPDLKKHGISIFIPPKEVTKKIEKSNIVEFCDENEILTPETIVIKYPSQLDKAIKEFGFPFYV